MRTYQRKRPKRWTDKDRRMAQAAGLRAEGRSLRQIAAELSVSHQTVSNDLARWDARQAEAAPANVVPLSRKASRTAVKNDPAAGHDVTPGFDTPRTTGDAMGLSVSEERIARAVAYLTSRGA